MRWDSGSSMLIVLNTRRNVVIVTVVRYGTYLLAESQNRGCSGSDCLTGGNVLATFFSVLLGSMALGQVRCVCTIILVSDMNCSDNAFLNLLLSARSSCHRIHRSIICTGTDAACCEPQAIDRWTFSGRVAACEEKQRRCFFE
jgi:hypothetical protein